MSIIPFPMDERCGFDRLRDSQRLDAVHVQNLALGELAASLGSPSEWLSTAVSHLKAQTSGEQGGCVEVSVAALHLVLMRLDELEHGGEPWRGDAA